MSTRPEELFFLYTPVTTLKGVGPAMAKTLARIFPVGEEKVPIIRDLLFHLPSGFIDRRQTFPLNQAPTDTIATFVVTVEKHIPSPPGRRGRPYKVICGNETGDITLVFFHAKGDYVSKTLPVGQERVISGTTEVYDGHLQMTHPDVIAPLSAIERVKTIEPSYPLTAGVTNRKLAYFIRQALERIPHLPEWIDEKTLKLFHLQPWHEAVKAMHDPKDDNDLLPAALPRMRMAYDEILANQLHLAMVRRKTREVKANAIKPTGKLREPLIRSLPFTLTDSQKAALKDIDNDLASGHRMVRMIQGDVGSGKTIVALIAALSAVEAGMQAALMAPTELIARQHAATLQEFCKDLPVNITFLAGSIKGAERKKRLAAIANGEVDIVVGTHALFQESVQFHSLSLAVIDEQHRFGVAQRMALASKGEHPHLLHMTATPIPRTLTMTCYGDMDCTLMTGKPAGRTPVKTSSVPNTRLDDIIARMKDALARGEKVYWICPMIEDEKETFHEDVAAAEERYRLFKHTFGEKVCGLVHGRMKADERDETMKRFAGGDIRLLVATTVVEVGVDVKDATIIIIEKAERFGLAQLHQLRGRVGRGTKQSSCLLIYSENASEDARARLNILRETEDGFRIAEEDLKIRGGGDLLGVRQSGMPQFRFTDLIIHRPLISHARDISGEIVKNNVTLEGKDGNALKILLHLYGYDYGY